MSTFFLEREVARESCPRAKRALTLLAGVLEEKKQERQGQMVKNLLPLLFRRSSSVFSSRSVVERKRKDLKIFFLFVSLHVFVLQPPFFPSVFAQSVSI